MRAWGCLRRARGTAACRGPCGGASSYGSLASIPPTLRRASGSTFACSTENSIPFTAAGNLLQEGAARTGCPHLGLLVGQRGDTRSLGLVGRLMRNARTFGRALQDLVDNQRRYIRGAAVYLIAAMA